MSDEPVTLRDSSTRRGTWIIQAVFWPFVIFVFLVMGDRFVVIIETPVHFVLGWIFHALRTLPQELVNWRPVVIPVGCLVLATWLIHRFVCWWFDAKEKPRSWCFRHTLSAVTLFLLGCAAAIAFSGVIHQSVWLMGTRLTERRGMNINLTVAVNNARQLMLALLEFQDKKGRFPESFQEFEMEPDIVVPGMMRRLVWVETDDSGVREPFLLLHPGGDRPLEAGEPVIVSPVIEQGMKIVVGYGDGSAKSFPAGQLEQVLRNRGRTSSQPSHDHE